MVLCKQDSDDIKKILLRYLQNQSSTLKLYASFDWSSKAKDYTDIILTGKIESTF